MKIAVYLRVSTKGQGEDDAYGLPKQQHDVQAFVEREGHEVVATFKDVGYSGATADRPDLAAMLAAEGFEAVVVPAWDRLARNTALDGYLRYTLEQRGVRVLSATQANGIDPTSELIQGVLRAVGQFERSLIAQRLAGGRKAKARMGGYAHGQAPFGTKATRKSGVLTIDEGELETLSRIRALRAEGATLRAIAAKLDEEGRATRHGGRWSAMTVRGALNSAHRVDAILEASARNFAG